MVAMLRTIAFMLVFYPGTAFAALSALVVSWFGQRALLAHVRGWALFHRWCARIILGVRGRLEGAIPDGPVIVAMKHESMFETIEVLLLVKDPAVVLKRELTNIPGWGMAARLHGVIPVDREAGAAAMRHMLRAARDAVARSRPIVIFPEGTRVPPGERPPLRAGFAGLYRALGLPVVPIACDSGHYWPRRGFAKRAGVIRFRVGETIPPGLPRDEVEARVHAAINALNDGA